MVSSPNFLQERELDLADWKAFEQQLEVLRRLHSDRGVRTPLLFRGHGDAAWRLKTTLERRGTEGMQLIQYYRVISAIKPRVDAFSKTHWDLPGWEQLIDLFANPEKSNFSPRRSAFPACSYLLYLRHHGFPSPLLDWTKSPYTAAFFAFRSHDKPQNGRVAIYVFLDEPENVKFAAPGKPFVRMLGPYIRSHPRHFLQQAIYTILLDRRAMEFRRSLGGDRER